MTGNDRNTSNDRRRRRTATGAVTLFGGLAILAAAALVAWSWRADLPDPVATHWGPGGQPDGFSSLARSVTIPLVIGVVIVLLFGGVTWARGQSSINRRLGAAGTAWTVLFLSTVLLGTLWVQRGLKDARDVGDVNGVLAAAFGISLVGAVLVALVVPGDPRQPTGASVAADAPRVALVEGERASWIARATSPAAFLVGVPVVVLSVALAVITQVWAVLIVDAVVIAALVAFSSFVVRVDRTGLTVRSALGWLRYRVPLDEVVRADVTQVRPLAEFGGWGWRVGRDGRVGVVLRKGEGLLVQRTGGRSLVVTVDGAATGAGLLNTLADRPRAT